MREFVRGIGMLVRGVGWWRKRPRLMLLGVVPALIVGLVLFGGIVALALNLTGITVAMTPFADGWSEAWAGVLRLALGTALLGGSLVLSAVVFTALTLLVGDPFYERIWKSVEREAGAEPPDVKYGFWRSIGDAVSLILRGLAVAALAALLGFVPVVGAVLSFGVGLLFGGWLLADELASRALVARGIPSDARRRMLRSARARVLGFGVATQLCFLVPFGTVLVMPAAVAGATELSLSLVAAPTAPRATGPDRPTAAPSAGSRRA